jgi:multidrug efflux pump subunit AcrA (membrane-fusion protein)
VAAAQIDQLELERLAHKRQLLARRIENLDIKSPIGGLVLTGDLDRSEGVPLTVGQPLYEIAPLDRMFAEIEIPDDEIEHVVEGQRVYVRLDALPGSALEGTLTELHPRSETRNGANVFIAEVMLDNPGEVLRPGMKGTAKIVTARRSLAWILFHRPWNWLASLLF